MGINREALFADGTPYYRTYSPDNDGYTVRLRFRTGRGDATAVSMISDRMIRPMKLVSSDVLFDYYEVVVSYPACGKKYHFRIDQDQETLYYNKRGVMVEDQLYYNFNFKPGFRTPDWAKGAVYYQIYTDRFYNGDTGNDVQTGEYYYIDQKSVAEKDWYAYPKTKDVANFYGGDLQGIIDKLDYLQELGIEVLYLNPIFVSPSNHKYDSQDYDFVDPHYGRIVKDGGDLLQENDKNNSHATRYIQRVTDMENLRASNEMLITLVEELHKRGMKIILDGVFNHCGSFNKWLDREKIYCQSGKYPAGAFISDNSPYRKFFSFKSDRWPYNGDYEGWWNHNTLPKLNYEGSKELYRYILDIGRKWVSPPYNCDGWRLDVAADLGHSPEMNHQFWKDFRAVVKKANPDAVILAENYSDPAAWLAGDEWDTIMNYEAFMDPVTYFLTGVEKHSDIYRGDLLSNNKSFVDAMSHHMSRFNYESLHTAMNELSNHDHSRFLTRTNGKVGRIATVGPKAADEGVRPEVMREAVVIQMTWPGAPTVYYGDEVGVTGWTDPDSRRTYPWGREDRNMLAFHKDIIRIHKSSEVLRRGSLKILYTEHGVLAFGRFSQQENYLTLVNNMPCEVQFTVPVWEMGADDSHRFELLLQTDMHGYSMESVTYNIKDGMILFEMPPKSAMILKRI